MIMWEHASSVGMALQGGLIQGYHHTQEYYEDQRSPFPPDLAKLSSFILEVAGFPEYVKHNVYVCVYTVY